MSTATQEQTLVTLTINRDLLTDLITGALVAADKSKAALSRTGSIYLGVSNGKITVKSTDRYRLVYGAADIDALDIEDMQILVADAKRILALIKDNKMASDITLTRAADSLSVAALGNSLTIYLMGDKFPDIEQLMSKDLADLSAISLNAEYLGSFAKVPTSDKENRIDLQFTASSIGGQTMATQIKIHVPHDSIDWRCLLMPMKVRS